MGSHLQLHMFIANTCSPTEDIFTTFEIQIWLPEVFSREINLVNMFCAWPIWAEVTHYLGYNIVISSLSIDRQLNI